MRITTPNQSAAAAALVAATVPVTAPARIPLGKLLITDTAERVVAHRLGTDGPQFGHVILQKHRTGDFGLLPPCAVRHNEEVIRRGFGTVYSLHIPPSCVAVRSGMVGLFIIIATDLPAATADDPETRIYCAGEASEPCVGGLFRSGQLKVTPGAFDVAEGFAKGQSGPAGALLVWLLLRHVAGDWSEMGDYDREINFRALTDGGRLLSAYGLSDGRPEDEGMPATRLWVITEADRSLTTILTPSEY